MRPLAVAMCDLDAWLMRGAVPFPGPFALGHEFVAEVVQAGEEAGVAIGDRVIVPVPDLVRALRARACAGSPPAATEVPPTSMYGIGAAGGDWGGAMADLVRVPFADAMLVRAARRDRPGGRGQPVRQRGRRAGAPWARSWPRGPGAPVLIVGGGAHAVSLYAVQAAVALGAERVDFLDTDPGRLALAERLGATPWRAARRARPARTRSR